MRVRICPQSGQCFGMMFTFPDIAKVLLPRDRLCGRSGLLWMRRLGRRLLLGEILPRSFWH